MGDVRQDFDDAFEAVRVQSNRHAAVERDPEHFDEIVSERKVLDRLRHEATDARSKVVSRFEPPAPDHVEQPRGHRSTRTTGKVLAGISVVLLIGVLGGVWFLFRSLIPTYPVDITVVGETVVTDGGRCTWLVDIEILNGYDQPIRIEEFNTIIDRHSRGVYVSELTVSPGQPSVFRTSFALEPASCTPVDELDHGRMRMSFKRTGAVGAGEVGTRF